MFNRDLLRDRNCARQNKSENFYFECGFHWCSKNVLWLACVIGIPRVKKKGEHVPAHIKPPSSYYNAILYEYTYVYTYLDTNES